MGQMMFVAGRAGAKIFLWLRRYWRSDVSAVSYFKKWCCCGASVRIERWCCARNELLTGVHGVASYAVVAMCCPCDGIPVCVVTSAADNTVTATCETPAHAMTNASVARKSFAVFLRVVFIGVKLQIILLKDEFAGIKVARQMMFFCGPMKKLF